MSSLGSNTQCDESNTQCDESFATDIDLSPPGSSMRKTTHKASPASTVSFTSLSNCTYFNILCEYTLLWQLSVESGSTSSAITVALATAMVPESKKVCFSYNSILNECLCNFFVVY